jgi:hypothetical protein
MTRNDGVEVRRERIAPINQSIMALFNNNKEKTEFPLDTILAEIEYNTGLTKKRILEYLSIGEKRGLFILDIANNRIRRTA